jgi:hypothetical protein
VLPGAASLLLTAPVREQAAPQAPHTGLTQRQVAHFWMPRQPASHMVPLQLSTKEASGVTPARIPSLGSAG